MASEDTILANAPVTPAHKFAWRAFRGFIYGSPESPEHMEKENSIAIHVSPTKRVKMEVPALSPQKRRSSQPSPTKSILRTPGAPTPRAKSLRDVNVKFKSISPEARASGPTAQPAVATIEKQVDSLLEDLQDSLHFHPLDHPLQQRRAMSESIRRRASVEGSLLVEKIVPSTAQMSPYPERDAYASRTEKEVKKLIRDRKLLKSMAQKAEAQKDELQEMVKNLQKENARLKSKLQNYEIKEAREAKEAEKANSQSGKRAIVISQAKTDNSMDAQPKSAQPSSISRTEAFKRSLRGEDPGFEVYNPAAAQQRGADAVASKSQKNKQPEQKPSRSLRGSPAVWNPTPAERASHREPSTAITQTKPSHEPAARHSVPSSAEPFSLTALGHELERSPSATEFTQEPRRLLSEYRAAARSTTSANRGRPSPRHISTSTARSPRPATQPKLDIPPARVEAIRERLRQKREQRKASVTTFMLEMIGDENALGETGRGGGQSAVGGHGAVEEESALDWAAI
jgi:hypothetical protein